MHVKTTNGTIDQYPYTVGQLRRDNPQTSFPRRISDEMLADYGVHLVNPVPTPSHDGRTQRVEQNAQPHMEAGKWFIGWTVVNKTAEEVQQYDDSVAASNRAKRDELLAETDWLVVYHTEKGTNIPLEVEVYRQTLRDITGHANWPHLADSDWPVKPA